MKRLYILTAVLVLTAGMTGCRCFDRLFRGASYSPPATTVIADPCNPCVPSVPCDPCSTGGACSAVIPGPGSYNGAPGT